MFDYVRGKLIEAASSHVVIDVGGLGYKLFIPIHLLGALPTVGKEITCFTSFVVKEDSHRLFGFLEKKERDLFETLLTISGIGPKTALSIIGHLPLPVFAQAIHKNHIPTFTKVPGIGKKTAERLLLELRGKIDPFEAMTGEKPQIQKISDALSALTNLGYPPSIAREALERAQKELPEDADLPSLISRALKLKP